MLDRAHRLRRRDEFTAAVRRGRRIGRGTLVVHLLPGAADASDPPRIGFIASRAVGPAVVRNRVRRRLRHLARSELGTLPPGTLVAVRALPASAQAAVDRLAQDLGEALAAARRPVRARRRTHRPSSSSGPSSDRGEEADDTLASHDAAAGAT